MPTKKAMLRHTHIWARVSMLEATEHVRVREMSEEPPKFDRSLDYQFSLDGVAAVAFTDGSVLVAESNYDSGYSDMTPGMGLEPPTFYLGLPKNVH